MNIDFIKKIELEITSDCNAACPGCARTLNFDDLVVTQFTLQDLKRILPDEKHIKGKDIRLCGVLGDPMIHPEVYEMTEYLLSNCLLYTSPSPRDVSRSRMPSSA